MNEILRVISDLGERFAKTEVNRLEFIEDNAGSKIELSKLITRHSVPQTIAAKICGLSLNNFKEKVAEAVEKGVIPAADMQGNRYLYTLNHLHALLTYFNAPKWSDEGRECIVANVGNQKGGTGKTSTLVNLAVKLATDLKRRLRILIIDVDPQGSIRDLSVSNSSNDSSCMMTAVDLMLGDTPFSTDLYNVARSLFGTHAETVKASLLETHIPNLQVLPAFPEDERFTELAFMSGDLNGYLKKLDQNVIAHLKDDYDLILIDSGPHNNPLVWSALEACNAILVPVSPRKLDWSSTRTYVERLTERLSRLPSKGENLNLFKIAIVNYDDEQDRDTEMLYQIKEETGRASLTALIKRSSAFEAAARQYCTVMDLTKNDVNCPARQIDKATQSLKDVATELVIAFKESFPSGVR